MIDLEIIRVHYPDPGEPDRAALWSDVESRVSRVRKRPRSRGGGAGRIAVLLVSGAVTVAAVIALLPRVESGGRRLVDPERASAAIILKAVARRAARLPDLQPGQFLYSRGERTVLASVTDGAISYSYWERMRDEIWVSLAGTIRDRWTFARKPIGYPTERDRIAAARDPNPPPVPPAEDTTTTSPEEFRRIYGLSLVEMRALSIDPDVLSMVIERIAKQNFGPNRALHTDDPVTAALQLLLGPTRPAVKAAVLDALATLPNVRRLPDEVIGGHAVVVVAFRFTPPEGIRPGGTYDHVLELDRDTGQLIGAQYVSGNRLGAVPAGTATSTWRWEQHLVTSLAATR